MSTNDTTMDVTATGGSDPAVAVASGSSGLPVGADRLKATPKHDDNIKIDNIAGVPDKACLASNKKDDDTCLNMETQTIDISDSSLENYVTPQRGNNYKGSTSARKRKKLLSISPTDFPSLIEQNSPDHAKTAALFDKIDKQFENLHTFTLDMTKSTKIGVKWSNGIASIAEEISLNIRQLAM